MIGIAAYYFFSLAALGSFSPYYTVLLVGTFHLSPAEATRLQALSPLFGLVMPLVVGVVADAGRRGHVLLRALTAGAAISFCGFFLHGLGRAAIYPAAIFFALFRSPNGTLVDAGAVQRAGASYGRLRLWGSIGFLVAVVAGGWLQDRVSIDAVLGLTLAGLVLASAATWALPAPPHRAPPDLRAWRDRLTQSDLGLFLAAIVCTQIANSAYDSCYALHLDRLLLPRRFTGAAIALGVVAEVVVLANSRALIARLGAERLLAGAFAVSAARWFGIARATSVPALLVLQPLHGVTFGCFWTASIAIVHERATPDAPNATQGLFATACALGTGAGLLVDGRIAERFGTPGLFVFAAGAAACACGFAVLFARRPATARATA